MNKLLLLNSLGLVKILRKNNTINTVTILVPPRNFIKPVEVLYKNLPEIFKREDFNFIRVDYIDLRLENYLVFYRLFTDEKDIGRLGIIKKINDKDESIDFKSRRIKLLDIEEIYYIY